MARTVTFYKVVHLLGDADDEIWFATKSGANANIFETQRLNPTADCRIDTETIDLDKEGVTALLNKVVQTHKRKT